MRIAIITSVFPALSETFVLEHIVELIRRGHDVTVFSLERPKDILVNANISKYGLLNRTVYYPGFPVNKFERILKAIPLFIKSFAKNPPAILRAMNFFRWGKEAGSLRNLFAIAPFVGREKFDVVHCHFGPNGNIGALIRICGVRFAKFVVSFHGYDANSFARSHGANIYYDLFKVADSIVANTEFIKRRLVSIGCSEEKIVVIPASFDVSQFHFNGKILADNEPVKLLSIGRLVEVKGTRFAIEAAAILKRKGIPFRYDVIGDGPLKSELEELINNLGVGDCVRLLGAKSNEEVKDFLRDYHILLQPSIRAENGDEEAQGLVIQEAQASGLIPLASDVGGISEGLLSRISGFLFPEKNPGAIAETIQKALSEKDRWGEMGNEGRKFVEEKYDVLKNVMLLEKLYTR
jgi:colanic acid/amylovoran biosynthesis glycosyltransferase